MINRFVLKTISWLFLLAIHSKQLLKQMYILTQNLYLEMSKDALSRSTAWYGSHMQFWHLVKGLQMLHNPPKSMENN